MTALLLFFVFGAPLCATEDSVDCVWVASIQGNGTGYDLYNVGDTSYYLPNGIPG